MMAKCTLVPNSSGTSSWIIHPTPSDLIDFPKMPNHRLGSIWLLLFSCLLSCLVTSNKVVNRRFNVFKLPRACMPEMESLGNADPACIMWCGCWGIILKGLDGHKQRVCPPQCSAGGEKAELFCSCSSSSSDRQCCLCSFILYRGGNKGLYVVARIFFLLFLNRSAWPCLGPA